MFKVHFTYRVIVKKGKKEKRIEEAEQMGQIFIELFSKSCTFGLIKFKNILMFSYSFLFT